MNRIRIALVAGLGSLALLIPAPAQATTGPLTTIGSPADLAVGSFNRNLYGVSAFVANGSTVNVYGSYAGLRKNHAYFTVIYAGNQCDPAAAFPVGPFTTGNNGRARLAANVPIPAAVDVGKTGSVSVRTSDTDKNGNPTDQDGDGLTGPTDVVAVPGKPKIGLIECDSSPYTVNT